MLLSIDEMAKDEAAEDKSSKASPVIDEMAKDEALEDKRLADLKGKEIPITKPGQKSSDSIVALSANLAQKAIDRLEEMVKQLRAGIETGEIDKFKKQLKKAGNSLRRAGVALDVAGGDKGSNSKEIAQDRWKKQKLFEDEVGYLKAQAQAARQILEVARGNMEDDLKTDTLQSILDHLKQASTDLTGPRSILAKVKGYDIPTTDLKFKKLQNKEDAVGRVQTSLDRAITETGDAIAYCDNKGDNPDFQQYAEHLDDALYAIAEASFALNNLITGGKKPDDTDKKAKK